MKAVFGHNACFKEGMESQEPVKEAKTGLTQNKALSVELRPKDAVRRILEAAGAEVSDKDAFWLGHHMERFVNHTRKHGEI